MLSPEQIAELKTEIERLKSARDSCTDSRVREMIAARIEELKQKLVSGKNPK
jgi:hypothetical protein